MNALVPTQTKLPAHLQHLAQNQQLMAMNTAAAAGISSGGWPRISLKQSRFRLQTPSGDEVIVPQLHLDVIIIDANPNGLSKVFYKGKWDPNAEGEAPDCYSDNGVGPSVNAKSPQCGTCAACPNNVWGSKISEASGKGIKACADSKKIAVFVADNTDGPVFELRVPADSLSNLGNYIKSLNAHGIPAASVITRMSFDSSVSHPKLIFAPRILADGQMPYIDQAQAEAVMSVIGTEEVDQCTGKNDRPIDGTKALAAPTPAAQNVAAAASTPPQNFTPPPMPPAPPAALPSNPAFPHHAPASAPVAFTQPVPPSAPATVPEAPAKRTRKKAAEFTPAQAAPAAPATPPPFLGGPPSPPSAASVAAPLTAPVTNATLDDIIAQAMKA